MQHIPNILSGFRIALIPFFVYCMTAGDTFAAAVLLIVSGTSDMLDGFLARRFGWITQLGKVLDPVADKLTQVTVCVMLAIHFQPLWPFFALLLFKDLVMLVLGGYLVKKKVRIESSRRLGKLTTVLFYVTMTLIMLIPDMPDALTSAMLTLTVLCALMAGLRYIPDFLRYNREHK